MKDERWYVWYTYKELLTFKNNIEKFLNISETKIDSYTKTKIMKPLPEFP